MSRTDELVAMDAIVSNATIAPAECTIFVQIWMDPNAAKSNSTRGIYLVDSNHSNGSSSEGTPTLNTNVPTGSKICWQLLCIDPNWTGDLNIANFSNAGVFGSSGTPKSVDATTWTGQVQDDGNNSYSITFNVQQEGGSGKTITVNPYLTVSNK